MDDGKAFDATESFLRDSSEGIRSKLTVSLMVAVRGILQRGPQFEYPSLEARREAFHAAAQELTRRGLDASTVIRYGMFREVAAPLLAGLLRGPVPDEQKVARISLAVESVLIPHPERLDVAGWYEALGIQIGGTPWPPASAADLLDFVEDVLIPTAPLIQNWVFTAPLDDLLLLTPPSDAESLQTYKDSFADDLRELYEWAVDYFTETFYHDWRTTSLHHTYGWLADREIPPCPAGLMNERRIDTAKLNAEIARRATSKQPNDPGALSPGGLLVPQMVEFAKPLLEEGRFREAAAVFEFGIQQMPNDSDLRNNLGFCLIPVDARSALAHLEGAEELGYSHPEINTHNQMWCCIILHNNRAALKVADRSWEKIRSRPAYPATLWRRGANDRWALFSTEDARQSVAELALSIAVSENREKEREVWANRIPELRDGGA